MKKHKQGFTLVTLAVALGVAVYLNWEYAKTADNSMIKDASAPHMAVTDPLAAEASAEQADKNYGEAQLVSAEKKNGSDFFDEARLNRTKSRDDALDSLKKSLKGTGLSGEEKQKLTQKLSSEIEHINTENEMETLVKAKGFADCVAFIDGDQVNVTVMTSADSLQADEVAQIRDIVLSRCDVRAQDICVVEIK